MNERIKELAEQAGFCREFALSGLWLADDEELERFAELIRADEREACANLCDEAKAARLAEQIRARGGQSTRRNGLYLTKSMGVIND